MRKSFFLISFLTLSISYITSGQSISYWKQVDEQSIRLPQGSSPLDILPTDYAIFELDLEKVSEILAGAPAEFSGAGLPLSIPMPDGTLADIETWNSPVMEPGLSRRYPVLQSFTARRTDGAQATGRLGLTWQGFHAAFQTPRGPLLITPYAQGQTRFYLVYFLNDMDYSLYDLPAASCGVTHEESKEGENPSGVTAQLVSSRGSGSTGGNPISLRTYRMAISCVGEFGIQQGGTLEGVMSAYMTTVNVGNVVWERDMAIRMILADETDKLIYLDPASDPYNPSTIPNVLSVNPTLFDATIGFTSYDIGHTWTASPTGGVAGLAGLGVVCKTGGQHKSRAASSNYTNNVAAMTIEVFAHEVGHQFSANHSFNNCNGNENPSTAFEPGSGSTIMSYAGSCGSNNVQFGADGYYNIGSLEEFISYSRLGGGSTCPVVDSTNNTEPILDLPYPDGFFIPISTPFELTATAFDEDGDDLTYTWEQYNLGPQVPLGSPILGAPSFRSVPPGSNPTRTFPRLSSILNNSSDAREVLPTYSRDMTFKCTVRDNHPGAGGAVWDAVAFEATEAAGPFLVLGPNSGSVVWEIGKSAEVTWDVANTDKAPVNCQFVDILLSTDGGNTFPIILANDVPNNGEATIVVPNTPTDDARVKVKAADNIFFDLSNQDFDIIINQPGYYFGPEPLYQEICAPQAALIEFNTAPLLGYDSLLEVSLISSLPVGATLTFSQNPFRPSEGATATIDLTDVLVGGTYELEFMIVAPDLDTAFRQTTLSVTATDFSDLQLLTPTDGAAGESQLPVFSWSAAANAGSYRFVLATNPAFGADDILEEIAGIQDTAFQSVNTLLEKGEVYFWKVIPSNGCASLEPNLPHAFSTFEQSCTERTAFDLPKVISGSGLPEVTSTINIPSGGEVADVNVTNVNGYHEFLTDIDIILQAPSGDKVTLIGSFFCPTSDFNVGFDSESGASLGCPPTSGGLVKPAQSLSKFYGQDAEGDWILSVKVTNGAGAGGSFDGWSLELCSDVSLNPPLLITNDTLGVQEGQGVTLRNVFLQTTDADNTAEELTYTLVTEPSNGHMTLGLDTLQTGSQFTQKDIDDFKVAYYHTDTTIDADQFYFIVDDGQGGWVEITPFNIVVDPDAWIVNTHAPTAQLPTLTVFPNPARDYLTLVLSAPLSDATSVEVCDLSGRRLLTEFLGRGQLQKQLYLDSFVPGIYLLRLESPQGVLTQKVVVQ